MIIKASIKNDLVNHNCNLTSDKLKNIKPEMIKVKINDNKGSRQINCRDC